MHFGSCGMESRSSTTRGEEVKLVVQDGMGAPSGAGGGVLWGRRERKNFRVQGWSLPF